MNVISQIGIFTFSMLVAPGIAEVRESNSKVTIGGIVWRTNYDEALHEARRLKKPLWLHFGENPG